MDMMGPRKPDFVSRIGILHRRMACGILALSISSSAVVGRAEVAGLLVRNADHNGWEFESIELRSLVWGKVKLAGGGAQEFATSQAGLILFWSAEAADAFQRNPKYAPFFGSVAASLVVIDKDPQSLGTTTEYEQLKKSLQELDQFAAKYRLAASHMVTVRNQLANQVRLFESGQRKVAGTWISPGAYAAMTWLAEPLPRSVRSESDLRPVKERIEKIRKLTADYPGEAAKVADFLRVAEKEIEYFESGSQKVNGKWNSSDELRQQAFQRLLEKVERPGEARREGDRFAKVCEELRLSGEERARLAGVILSALGSDIKACGGFVAVLEALPNGGGGVADIVRFWKEECSRVEHFCRRATELLVGIDGRADCAATLRPSGLDSIGKIPDGLFSEAGALQKEVSVLSATGKYSPLRQEAAGCVELLQAAQAITNMFELCEHGSWGRVKEEANSAMGLGGSKSLRSNGEGFGVIRRWYEAYRATADARIAAAEAHIAAADNAEKESKWTVVLEELKAAHELTKNPDLLEKIRKIREGSLGL